MIHQLYIYMFFVLSFFTLFGGQAEPAAAPGTWSCGHEVDSPLRVAPQPLRSKAPLAALASLRQEKTNCPTRSGGWNSSWNLPEVPLRVLRADGEMQDERALWSKEMGVRSWTGWESADQKEAIEKHMALASGSAFPEILGGG